MNLRRLFTIIALAFTSLMYCQKNKTVITSINTNVTEVVKEDSKVIALKFETTDINDLTKLDWETVRDVFSANNPNDSLTLSFKYTKPLSFQEVTTQSFKLDYLGKTSELEELIKASKKVIETLAKDKK